MQAAVEIRQLEVGSIERAQCFVARVGRFLQHPAIARFGAHPWTMRQLRESADVDLAPSMNVALASRQNPSGFSVNPVIASNFCGVSHRSEPSGRSVTLWAEPVEMIVVMIVSSGTGESRGAALEKRGYTFFVVVGLEAFGERFGVALHVVGNLRAEAFVHHCLDPALRER